MNHPCRQMKFSNASRVFAMLCTCAAIAVASEPRAFILDSGSRSVVAMDIEKGAIQGTAALGGNLTSMFQVPRSRKLVVLDHGPWKASWTRGAYPTGNASLYFVDMASLQRTSHLELTRGPGPMVVSSDGRRIAVECLGNLSKNPDETVLPELVIVDAEREEIIGRVPLSRQASLLLAPDNRTLVVFAAASASAKGAIAPAEVTFVDLGTARALGTLTPRNAVTSAVLSADGRYLYLLDPGKSAPKAGKNASGFVVVISVPNRAEVGVIDVGASPQGLIQDATGDRILILGDANPAGGPGDPDGVLRVIKGTETVAVCPVAPYPLSATASPDGSLLYVVSHDCISIVDYPGFKPLQRMPFRGFHGRGAGAGDAEFAVTPDGKRGFAVFGDKLPVFDLEGRKSLASVKVGRGTVRFVQALTAGAQTYVSAANATYVGSGWYTYQVHSIKPGYEGIALSPDSRYAYVLNSQTHDVTAVDARNGTVLSKISIRGMSPLLRELPGSRFLCVKQDVFLSFIDMATNQKVMFNGNDYIKVGGVTAMDVTFQVSPSGQRALSFARKNLVILDPMTLQVVAKLTNFENIAAIVFER